MINNPAPYDMTVNRAGPVAALALEGSGTGSVVAVFDRCFYVQINETHLCLGNSDFTDGPLNVVTSAPVTTNWSACGLRTGDRAHLFNRHLQVGSHIRFEIQSLDLWQPEPVILPVNIDELLITLETYFFSRRPSEGLAPTSFLSTKTLSNQSVKSINAFSDWFKKQLESTKLIEWDNGLLGAGPGLTPSGDDFLGAALITLHALSKTEIAAALFCSIEEKLKSHTNPISAQHLIAASQGLGGIAFHDVVSASGHHGHAGLPQALNQLIEVGHTSGWDALAGLYITLKTWHKYRRSLSVAA